MFLIVEKKLLSLLKRNSIRICEILIRAPVNALYLKTTELPQVRNYDYYRSKAHSFLPVRLRETVTERRLAPRAGPHSQETAHVTEPTRNSTIKHW